MTVEFGIPQDPPSLGGAGVHPAAATLRAGSDRPLKLHRGNLRKSLGLTQVQMAQKMGVTPSPSINMRRSDLLEGQPSLPSLPSRKSQIYPN